MKKIAARGAVFVSLSCFLATQCFAQYVPNERVLTVDQLQQMYPDAKLHAVTAAEFAQIRRDYAVQSVVVVDNLPDLSTVDPAPVPREKTELKVECPAGTVARPRNTDTSRAEASGDRPATTPAPSQFPAREGTTAPPDAASEFECVPVAPSQTSDAPCPPGQVPTIQRSSGAQPNPESGQRTGTSTVCVPEPKTEPVRPEFNVNVLGEYGSRAGRGSGKDSEILYVVIGVVVVAALIVYSFKYAYDIAAGRQYDRWWDTGLESMFMSGANAVDEASFAGIKFAGGIVDDAVRVGLAGEIGYMDANLLRSSSSGGETKRVHVSGAYGFIGPAVRWTIEQTQNPSYMFLELIGGTAADRSIGMLSVARVGFNLGIDAHMRFGLNYGAMYTNLQEGRGLLGSSAYNSIYGVEFGVRF